MTAKADLVCAECGSNQLSIPAEGADEDCVLCGDCGAEVGTLGELKAMVAGRILGGRPDDRT